jgi:hypothetical protein
MHLHLMHCTILFLACTYSYMLDHVEPEPEEPMKQAEVKELTNLAWIKARPGAFNQCPCLLF